MQWVSPPSPLDRSFLFPEEIPLPLLPTMSGDNALQGFKLYTGSLGRNGEKCQCLLAMYHPVYNYLHILSVSFLPQDLVSQKPVTLKADLSTFIPQHNIKNLFQEK